MNKRELKSLKLFLILFVGMLLLGEAKNSSALDHDADGKSDYIVYRPVDSFYGNSVWFVNSSALSGTLVYQWGLLGDIPVQGKFSGGAGSDLAIFRPSQGIWAIRNYSTDLKFSTASTLYQWGLSGDQPFSCDVDGDSGRSDLTVYRPTDGVWYTRKSSATTPFSTTAAQQWGGVSGDVAIPRDYDADSKCDYTVFRSGSWFVLLSSTSNTIGAVIPWGATTDVPVPGKYDNDSIEDFAVYRPSNSTWHIRLSNLAGLTSRSLQWGLTGDIPVPADYTGDGKTDIAVWRPSTGTYYILTSESNYTTPRAQQFGLNGDIPMGDRRGF